MDLSNNLVSQFAKLNNTKGTSTNETIVYGTAVAYGDKIYVNIDGSDTVTPVTSTAEVKAGERVTILLKDHSATILGNITNPSASVSTTNKILDDYDVIIAKMGNFEILIADVVNTEKLNAELAIIEKAIIEKASITELEAVKASIKDLDVSHLTAEIAKLDQAMILKADISDLDALRADIASLDADLAEITTLVGGNLTMDNIQSLVLTSSKVTVDNAFIKDAMIDRMSASKLTAGNIDTSLINIGSEDGAMSISGSLQQFKDSDGTVRIQIGKDATGDFTFVLYGADGQGQLINQNGITASAIEDGLIVNKMVADNAGISGSKLDIDSVIETINGGTKTILGTKIYLDEQNQTLEAAFKQLHTTVEDDVKEQISTNITNINVMQGEINSLISNTTISKEDGVVVSLKDELNSVIDTIDRHTQTISSLETEYDSITGEMETVTSTVTKMEQSLDGFEQSITSSISGLETRVNSAEQKMTTDGIMTIVTSSTAWNDQTATIEGFRSSVNQNADKISWLVKSGTDSSNMELTDNALSIISSSIDLTGRVTFEDFSTSVMDEITDKIEYQIGQTVITGDMIQTGSISLKHLSTNNDNPIIFLFDECSIDATKQYNEGQGTAIRLKWNDYNYIAVTEDEIDFFVRSNGELTPVLSIEGTPYRTVLGTRNGKLILSENSQLSYNGYNILTAYNYDDYCAPYNHSHYEYAYSDHYHDGYVATSSTDWFESGSHDPYYSNSYNLGYSSYRWNQVCAANVWADYCSDSDIEFKENIKYIKLSDMINFSTGTNEDSITLKPNIANDKTMGVTNMDLHDFVKYDLKLCEYNYNDEYVTNAQTNEPMRTNFDRKLGFIAQDVLETKIGELIAGEHEGRLSYNLNNFMTVLAGALQYEIIYRDEQMIIIENLFNEIINY